MAPRFRRLHMAGREAAERYCACGIYRCLIGIFGRATAHSPGLA